MEFASMTGAQKKKVHGGQNVSMRARYEFVTSSNSLLIMR